MPYAKTSFAEKTNPFQQKVFIDLFDGSESQVNGPPVF